MAGYFLVRFSRTDNFMEKIYNHVNLTLNYQIIMKILGHIKQQNKIKIVRNGEVNFQKNYHLCKMSLREKY